MTKLIRTTGPCFHLSLPHQRGQRDVFSHTEFISAHILHALIFQTIPFELPRKPSTANWWDPTLSTLRGDKYYNQYRPQCEVCPRDHGKTLWYGSREDVVEKNSYLDLWQSSCLVLQNHLCSFERHHGEYSFEVIWNLDQWFKRRGRLKTFLI